MMRDAHRVGVGEHGKATNLRRFPLDLQSELYKIHRLNAKLSDIISVNRSVPDFRPKACKLKVYLRQLPMVSIIVTFFNEHKSVLLRSLHSLVNRSPPELVKEIILVDDFSDLNFLQKPLENYVAQHFKNVRILRLRQRSGPIRARMAGALNATAEVLVFTRSHVEVGYNWLPPLLEPIALNDTTVMGPTIDQIDGKMFGFRKGVEGVRSGFNWNFHHVTAPRLPEDLVYPLQPFKTPILLGETLVISSKFFWQLGGYDKGLNQYGGEEYDLSFKIWMCGGELYEAPCSRVAHINRTLPDMRSDTFHRNKILKNYKRVAEIWMGGYKKYLYKRNGMYKSIMLGNLEKQKALRSKLNCNSFKWYLQNVAFDFMRIYAPFEPPDYALGVIQNLGNPDFCVNSPLESNTTSISVGLEYCADNSTGPPPSQFWALTWHRDLRINDRIFCLETRSSKSDATLWLYKCHNRGRNQYWYFDYKQKLLKQGQQNPRCLAMLPKTNELVVSKCDNTNNYMHWNFGFVNKTALMNFNNTWTF
ncbi:N-acetylgalactosaminyltransferase 6-like [Scaptodrosophila lebanonensis]|uniref:Polypeptide N-acetylgalactosaminyltransferase n=1 Tax=Drosophila lebanonensis TaxID=7225 RepID=A0A6J2TCT6_DROLE|nr:N-acetylgalactosaminyltransferase 6-like [Scaptodrosophila lebanonensis]